MKKNTTFSEPDALEGSSHRKILGYLEGGFSLALKSFFLYDLMYWLFIKPVEVAFYTRISDSLIITGKNELQMSLSFKLQKRLRKMGRFEKGFMKKLEVLNEAFAEGLQKLDFNNPYYTTVNKVILRSIHRNPHFLVENISYEVIHTYEKPQVEAKLFLISTSDLWKSIFQGDLYILLPFLLRTEEMYRIKISYK